MALGQVTLDSIKFTLYDFLGYLLPGYVLLVAASVTEASFFDTSLLAMSGIADRPLLLSVAAYFLGQAAHRIAGLVKEWRYTWLSRAEPRLSDAVRARVREEARALSGITNDEDALTPLEIYLLADSYVAASEAKTDRDVLMAREGFCKTSMVAFGLLCIALLSSLTVNGATFQTEPGSAIQVGMASTAFLAAIAFCLSVLFRSSFLFFNRAKVNNTLLNFLVLREKGPEVVNE